MGGSHTSFSFCKKSGSLPSPVPTVLGPAHSPQIPKHTHRKSLSSEVLGNASPGQLHQRLPADRCTYMRRGWCFLSCYETSRKLPFLFFSWGEKGQEFASWYILPFLASLCAKGIWYGAAIPTGARSVGPLLHDPVSHPVLRSLSDAGRVALCTPAHSC